MDLLYAQEHLSCFQYDNPNDPTIDYFESEKKEQKKYIANKNVIFFTLDGCMSISFGKVVNKFIEKGDIFLLPADNEMICTIIKPKTKILLIKLPIVFSFCDHYSLEMLYHESKKNEIEITTIQILKINERTNAYINGFLPNWQEGLRCRFYLELKIKELFFLLRAYTPRDELSAFFSPILSDNMEFYNLVKSNYKSAQTIKELAQMTNYSVVGFEKKFKKVFGMPPYQWKKAQISSNLYHEIRCSNKTFTEISDDFNFSSSAHLSNFCKSVFGLTPKAIRKGETITSKNKNVNF